MLADSRPEPVGIGGGCSLARGLGDAWRVGASEAGFLVTDVLREFVVSGGSTSIVWLGCGGDVRGGATWGSDEGVTYVRSGEGAVGIEGAGGSMRLDIGEAPGRETGLGGV